MADFLGDVLGAPATTPATPEDDAITAPMDATSTIATGVTNPAVNADAKVSPPSDDPVYTEVFNKRSRMEGYEQANQTVNNLIPQDQKPVNNKADPHGIDLSELVDQAYNYAAYDMKMSGRVLKDIGTGLIVKAPGQIYGGMADAWNETLRASDSAVQWITDNINETLGFSPEKVAALREERKAAGDDHAMEKALSIPTTEKTDNNTASILRGMSQFAAAFMPVARGLKALGMGQKLASTLSAGAASAIAFDPAEKGLTDLVQETLSDEGKPFLEGPIADFMTTDPNDPEGVNRLKKAIKGSVGGVAADYIAAGLGRMLGAIKANRMANGIAMRSAAEKEVAKARVETLMGDTSKPIVDEATANKLLDGTHTVEDLANGLNFEKIGSAKELGALIKYITDGSQASAALKGGVAMDAKGAAAQLKHAATDRLKKIAEVATGSSDTAELLDFARMMKVASGIGKFADGDLQGAANALKASQQKFPKGKNYFAQLDANLMEEGGPIQIRKVARIVKDMENTPEALVKAAQLARGSAWGNGIQSWWYFDLLSGTMTQAANVAGTLANTLGAVPTRFLASGVSDAVGGGVAAGEAPAMFYGMTASVKAAMKGFAKTWRTMTSEFDSNSITEQRLFNMEVNGLPISSKRFNINTSDTALGRVWMSAIDGFGQVVAAPTRALMATDEFFKGINNQMEMNALAYRKAVMEENLSGKEAFERMKEILNNPTEEMLQGAADYAAKTTFNAPLDAAGNNLSAILNRWPITKAVIPFHKIAINLTKWTAENSPLGLLSSNIRNTIAAGGPEGDIALAKLAMGSMASMALVDLAAQGTITANGPRDPALRAEWLLNHKPWSIKHTDENGIVTWTPYNRVSPHGILMGMAASMGETYHLMEDEDLDKMAGAMAMATSRAFLNSTFMKGLADLFEAVDSMSLTGFQRYVNDQVATFTIPGIINSLRQIDDPVWRDAVTMNDAIANRIPGYLNQIIEVEGSDSLPPVQNQWGDAIQTPGNALERAIVPVVSENMPDDPVNNFIVDNKVRLDKPSKTQHDIELTPQEYAAFNKEAGAPAKAELDKLFAGTHPMSGTFNRQSDGPNGGKALMIQKIVQAHRNVAQAKLLRNPDFSARYQANVSAKAQALRGSGQSGGVRFGP